jgi:UDP-N-acetylmuramyl tripeptide synthase
MKLRTLMAENQRSKRPALIVGLSVGHIAPEACQHGTDHMSEKVKKVVSWAIVGLIVLFAVYIVWDYMIVDHCLDRGGRWNYSVFRCES